MCVCVEKKRGGGGGGGARTKCQIDLNGEEGGGGSCYLVQLYWSKNASFPYAFTFRLTQLYLFGYYKNRPELINRETTV